MNKFFNISVTQRYVLLICSALLCYIIGSVIVGIILGTGMTEARMRIALVIQDIVMFILPALIVAVIATRRPADFLCVDRYPSFNNVMFVLMAVIVSAPAMNVIISWNQNLHLPESMAGIEQWMRQSETSAAEFMSKVTGGASIGGLIISILIIGVMAGFSEELFFRGTLQRIMQTSPVNPHLAIWATAVIFSAIHLQFFGFVPRMLLGAFFGYLVWWSGSLWLGIAGHIFNNTMAIIVMWLYRRSGGNVNADSLGIGASTADIITVVASIVLTSLILSVLYFRLRRRHSMR